MNDAGVVSEWTVNYKSVKKIDDLSVSRPMERRDRRK